MTNILQIIDSVTGNYLSEGGMNATMLAPLSHLMKPAIINFLIEP